MQIAGTIYYQISTKKFICDTGQREGAVIPTTLDDDIANYSDDFGGIARDDIGIINLAFSNDYLTERNNAITANGIIMH